MQLCALLNKNSKLTRLHAFTHRRKGIDALEMETIRKYQDSLKLLLPCAPERRRPYKSGADSSGTLNVTLGCHRSGLTPMAFREQAEAL